MAFSRPFGTTFAASGKTEQERADDLRTIDQLGTFLPLEAVALVVREYFAEQGARDALDAFGGRGTIDELLEELPVQVAESVRRELHDIERHAMVTDDLVNEEAATTQAELVRHWVNGVLHAWTLWGRLGNRLILRRDTLMPSRTNAPPEVYENWLFAWRESVSSLTSSLAASEDNMGRLNCIFAANFRTELERRPLVRLPHRLQIRLEAGDPTVTVRV